MFTACESMCTYNSIRDSLLPPGGGSIHTWVCAATVKGMAFEEFNLGRGIKIRDFGLEQGITYLISGKN